MTITSLEKHFDGIQIILTLLPSLPSSLLLACGRPMSALLVNESNRKWIPYRSFPTVIIPRSVRNARCFWTCPSTLRPWSVYGSLIDRLHHHWQVSPSSCSFSSRSLSPTHSRSTSEPKLIFDLWSLTQSIISELLRSRGRRVSSHRELPRGYCRSNLSIDYRLVQNHLKPGEASKQVKQRLLKEQTGGEAQPAMEACEGGEWGRD